MIHTLCIIIGIAGILAFLGAGWFHAGRNRKDILIPLANAGNTTETRQAGLEAEEETHEHGHEAEESDLDRPVEALWASECEHNLPTYACDECRYEVGVVKLPPEMIDGNSDCGFVKIAQASRMQFSEERQLSGELGVSEEKTSSVISPLTGVVKAVHVKAGDRVDAGSPLFDIDSEEVAEGKAAYIKTLAAFELAKKLAAREAALFEKKISARSDVEEADARLAEARAEVAEARARLLRLEVGSDVMALLAEGGEDFSGLATVRAPIGGVVMEKFMAVGEFAEVGKNLLRISDISEVWAWANLREADLAAIREAGTVYADVELPGGGKQRGSVDLVSNTMDKDTRTARARITLPNPNGELRPGLFVGITLLLPGKGVVMAVPKHRSWWMRGGLLSLPTRRRITGSVAPLPPERKSADSLKFWRA